MPTVPTATSGCAILTATANGTYRNEREREGALRPTRRLLSPRETERGREGRTWYPCTTGIFCAAQLLPELTSTRSTPSFFSSSASKTVCPMPHCSHFPPASLFRTHRPIRSAEPHEERSFCPRGTDGLDDAEREAHMILEGLTTVVIRARVCERREEGV